MIPSALRLEMLDRIHTGHQGISKCRERAKQSLWWPGLSRQLEELVKNCSTCQKCLNQRREPLIPTALPELPWQRVGTDLFEFRGHSYLLVVDYYSRFIEIARVYHTTSEEIILQTNLPDMESRRWWCLIMDLNILLKPMQLLLNSFNLNM